MYTPYVRISNGGNVYTTLDASAKNTLGSIYSPPPAPTLNTTTKGYGAQPVFKYVLYQSTLNPAPVNAPAPVYYTDESFTTVSGAATEGFFTTGGSCIAGWLLPNTISIPGLVASSTTAPSLNGSYCFIQIGGLLVGAFSILAGAVGDYVMGATSGNWTSTYATTITASSRVAGIQWSTEVGGFVDILVGGLTTFWGS